MVNLSQLLLITVVRKQTSNLLKPFSLLICDLRCSLAVLAKR